MSFYNEPRHIQRFGQELESAVIQGAGYRCGQQLKEAFKYFSEPNNFNSLVVMKVEKLGSHPGQNTHNLLKVEKVVNGYTSFGFKNEALKLLFPPGYW